MLESSSNSDDNDDENEESNIPSEWVSVERLSLQHNESLRKVIQDLHSKQEHGLLFQILEGIINLRLRFSEPITHRASS
jgi:hypothetical protein